MARPVGSLKTVRTNFAKNFTKLLNDNNVSCYKLAKEIDYSESCLSRIKAQRSEPSIGLLVAVSKYFNVTIDSLLA